MSYSWTYVACKCPYNPYIGVSASNYYMKTVLVISLKCQGKTAKEFLSTHWFYCLTWKKIKFVVFKWSRMPTVKFQKSS